MAISKDQQKRFLENLEKHAVVTRAAAEADIKRVGELYTLRRTNKDFMNAWNDALETGRLACEDQARQRAFFGTSKPVYQGGQCVGYVNEYSDALAKMILEADNPERYNRGQHVHITGDLKTRVAAMSDEEINEKLAQLATKLGLKV